MLHSSDNSNLLIKSTQYKKMSMTSLSTPHDTHIKKKTHTLDHVQDITEVEAICHWKLGRGRVINVVIAKSFKGMLVTKQTHNIIPDPHH